MMMIPQIILVPIPVDAAAFSAGQNGGWQKLAKPVYPRKPSNPLLRPRRSLFQQEMRVRP
jgi:hypothetical protein